MSSLSQGFDILYTARVFANNKLMGMQIELLVELFMVPQHYF